MTFGQLKETIHFLLKGYCCMWIYFVNCWICVHSITWIVLEKQKHKEDWVKTNLSAHIGFSHFKILWKVGIVVHFHSIWIQQGSTPVGQSAGLDCGLLFVAPRVMTPVSGPLELSTGVLSLITFFDLPSLLFEIRPSNRVLWIKGGKLMVVLTFSNHLYTAEIYVVAISAAKQKHTCCDQIF